MRRRRTVDWHTAYTLAIVAVAYVIATMASV
jgi:hypothetical protein